MQLHDSLILAFITLTGTGLAAVTAPKGASPHKVATSGSTESLLILYSNDKPDDSTANNEPAKKIDISHKQGECQMLYNNGEKGEIRYVGYLSTGWNCTFYKYDDSKCEGLSKWGSLPVDTAIGDLEVPPPQCIGDREGAVRELKVCDGGPQPREGGIEPECRPLPIKEGACSKLPRFDGGHVPKLEQIKSAAFWDPISNQPWDTEYEETTGKKHGWKCHFYKYDDEECTGVSKTGEKYGALPVYMSLFDIELPSSKCQGSVKGGTYHDWRKGARRYKCTHGKVPDDQAECKAY
ncbi:hypothetical protein M011DRAFT_487329 [Sporormia fimetaria CBS 119925]|uniref:Uncharacterized protein n=1 Tax=Sporormia fimetaria CBS 119925 TaxID=1340428 RepID=A0A6A6V7T4_9PLEO|nr:hypothetical protein M011DRAFT_487329 [Sporormia fimetaria CBS 119925]